MSNLDKDFWLVIFLMDLVLIFSMLVVEFLKYSFRNDYLKLDEAYSKGKEYFSEYVKNHYLDRNTNWDGVDAAEIISMAAYKQAKIPKITDVYEGIQWTAAKIILVLIFMLAIGFAILGSYVMALLVAAFGILALVTINRIKVMSSWREKSVKFLEEASKSCDELGPVPDN
jgi:Flp pilus assembly protein TadB